MVYYAVKHLDGVTAGHWEESIKGCVEEPSLDDLTTFLRTRCMVLEQIEPSTNQRESRTKTNAAAKAKTYINQGTVTNENSANGQLNSDGAPRTYACTVCSAESHRN